MREPSGCLPSLSRAGKCRSVDMLQRGRASHSPNPCSRSRGGWCVSVSRCLWSPAWEACKSSSARHPQMTDDCLTLCKKQITRVKLGIPCSTLDSSTHTINTYTVCSFYGAVSCIHKQTYFPRDSICAVASPKLTAITAFVPRRTTPLTGSCPSRRRIRLSPSNPIIRPTRPDPSRITTVIGVVS